MGEHTKKMRPSTREKHEGGQARQRKDAKGEKGDAKRKHPPRKRRRSPDEEGK